MSHRQSVSKSHYARDKAEQELSTSVRKAISIDETAPKQKHVRVATVFTWDWETAIPFWNALKLHLSIGDEIQCFKALITIHKVMRDGHACALQETMREVSFLDSILRSMQFNSQYGYSRLIQSYIGFIKSKLELHKMHSDFTANFDYEDYRALKKVDDPNEGYNTIVDLFNLQDKVDEMQKGIFSSLRPSSNNECRIAALVPLIEESYGIYKFITSMLNAMHVRVESHEVLGPLRDRYRVQYKALQKFFGECANLRYLTSLITIPHLADLPPEFTEIQEPRRSEPATPRERTPPPEDIWGSVASITPEPNWALANREFEQHQQMMVQHQIIHQNNAQQELDLLRHQCSQSQQLLNGYEGRIRQLENLVNEKERLRFELESRFTTQTNFDLERERRDREKDDLIQSLYDQIAHWKSKYENIAKMYAQLRKEHLELLQKTKDLQSQASAAKQLSSEKDLLNNSLKDRVNEVASLKKAMTQQKEEFEAASEVNQREISHFKNELNSAQARFQELLQAKGNEVESLIRQVNAEKNELQSRLEVLQAESDRLKYEGRQSKAEYDLLKAELEHKAEEIAIFQAGMDQSLLALKELQENNRGTEADLLAKLDNLSLDHRLQLDKIMDAVLEDCKGKVVDGIYELENPTNGGSQAATVELVLSLLEKAASIASEFATSFSKRIVHTDSSGVLDSDAIRHANNLAHIIVSLLNHGKGMATNTSDDNTISDFVKLLKSCANSGHSFFHVLQSTRLAAVEISERPKIITQNLSEFQSCLEPVIRATEGLAGRQNIPEGDDLSGMIDSELTSVAKSIEDAARHLQTLLEGETDPSLTQVDLQVHKSILSSAKAITDAIARLIICATHSQQEIVTNGKGSGSKAAFYKKNSRWMEGLISAAKAVATATKVLVECADGVVHGTHNMEQLIVSVQEVSAATAQLVAASRVKAVRGSKTQDKLESAAKAVIEGTKILAQTVERIREKSYSQQENIDYSKLSAHEFKKREMEQQVQILTLEKRLTEERKKLAEMRRVNYHRESDYSG